MHTSTIRQNCFDRLLVPPNEMPGILKHSDRTFPHSWFPGQDEEPFVVLLQPSVNLLKNPLPPREAFGELSISRSEAIAFI
ncbi:MAG: hypothetical protein KME57_08725 [Scytonema hyalinum WJT4-NPBG1]|jgi:hypothetical protein|nr:hypothetical protein [Scytonema hyalinum WJT4-NPBG1]